MSNKAWQNFLNGDQSSFSELYFTYFNELLLYGKKIGFDEDTCKDVIQDLFFKIYIYGNKLKHVQHIEFYLLQSLKNALFEHYNREKNMLQFQQMDIEPNVEENGMELLILEESRNEQDTEIQRLLSILPPKQKKIIQYRYLLNLENPEIADLMRMTPEAVKKNIYRALRKMKNKSPSWKKDRKNNSSQMR